MRKAIKAWVIVFLSVLAVSPELHAGQEGQAHAIEILADHDSRFKVPGQDNPVITVKAGEPVELRITAVKAKNRNRDGSVHGFSLLDPNRKPVPGWELLLKPGTQVFNLTAPAQPGEYLVVCTVICSSRHEQMTMKFVVEPSGK